MVQEIQNGRTEIRDVVCTDRSGTSLTEGDTEFRKSMSLNSIFFRCVEAGHQNCKQNCE